MRQCLHQLQLWLPGSWSSSEGLLVQGLLAVRLLEQGLLAEGLHVEPCPAGCLSPHSVHHSCGQVSWQMWIHAAVVHSVKHHMLYNYCNNVVAPPWKVRM